jgi:hypothetical protein
VRSPSNAQSPFLFSVSKLCLSQVEQQCPLCPFKHSSPLLLEEHINRAHFDLTSPSFPPADPTPNYNGGFAPLATFSGGASSRHKDYHCPFCSRSFYDTPDLELHVNIEHKDILSPCKVTLVHFPQNPVQYNYCDAFFSRLV